MLYLCCYAVNFWSFILLIEMKTLSIFTRWSVQNSLCPFNINGSVYIFNCPIIYIKYSTKILLLIISNRHVIHFNCLVNYAVVKLLIVMGLYKRQKWGFPVYRHLHEYASFILDMRFMFPSLFNLLLDMLFS